MNPIGGERSVRLMQRSITVNAFKLLAEERKEQGLGPPSNDEAAVLGVRPEIAAEVCARNHARLKACSCDVRHHADLG